MDKKIIDFLQSQSVFSFCTSVNDDPYCAPCMYVFNSNDNSLVFASDWDTNHIENALLNARVAGTILPDVIDKANVKGIQFSGQFCKTEKVSEYSKKLYYKKFPFALVLKGDIWEIKLNRIKMTDNTLGFGKKLIWELHAAEL